jgi:HEAT repeat protein
MGAVRGRRPLRGIDLGPVLAFATGKRLATRAARAAVGSAWIGLAVSLGEAQQPVSVDELLEKLGSGSGATEAACQLGRSRDPRVFQPLVTALEASAVTGVRTCAASGLGDLGDPRAVDVLLRALDDPDAMTRSMVAYALGAYPEPRVLTRLIDVLERHADSRMRLAAAGGLGRAADAVAVEPMARALRQDGDASVRYYVAQALGSFPRSPAAVDALISCLASDVDASARASAARSLGRLKDPRARDSLQRALQDADPRVRQDATAALGRLGRPARP